MGELTVSLTLPHELLNALDVQESQLAAQILETLVLDLYRQQRISSGKCGEILGIGKWDFIQLLSQRNIAYFNETPDELSEQLAAVESLLDTES